MRSGFSSVLARRRKPLGNKAVELNEVAISAGIDTTAIAQFPPEL
jgi:hypothetical protein